MNDIVITAGDLYTEIDVLASALSYCELLNLQGITSRSVLCGPFNKSITDKISKWPLKYDKKPGNISKSSFVIVDISEPTHIAPFVDQEKIVKLFDHHFGFEDYWHKKYGDNAIVEKVGACATLIWEEYIKSGYDSKISHVSANLISTAIVSNTLNFKASVTSDRDITAYNKLKKYTKLPHNWTETYFQDQELFAQKYPFKAVKEDTFSITTDLPFELTIGQLELWNGKGFIEKNMNEIINAMESSGNNHWFLTLPSISEGKNYIYSKNSEVRDVLSRLLNVKFVDSLAITDKLILRKEIKKLLLS